ncbi:MAG: 50S ribosomal protein L10, partial [Acidimicrobiaceae bacterium]|nr:50S ribosomal protein L10 [Acidimicrobiaceae bacterium]
MGEARSEKVAVVDEVREKFSASDAAVLTEYRGLDVPAMAELRRALRESGGEYKVYKNTLVRFAVEELGLEIDDLLTGPTAIAFVGEQADGSAGDPVGVAKALKEFAKANEALAREQCVVIGLQTTGESQDASANLTFGEDVTEFGFLSTTREMLVNFLNVHFPTEIHGASDG